MFVHVNSIYISYYVFFDFGTIWKCDYISHRYLLIFVCYLYVSWSPLGVDFTSKGGRPCKITETCSRRMKLLIVCGDEKNAGTVSRRLREERIINLTPQSVRNALRSSGLQADKRIKKPMLTRRQKKLREISVFFLTHNEQE